MMVADDDPMPPAYHRGVLTWSLIMRKIFDKTLSRMSSDDRAKLSVMCARAIVWELTLDCGYTGQPSPPPPIH